MNRMRRFLKIFGVFLFASIVIGSALSGLEASINNEPTGVYLIAPALFFILAIWVVSGEET